MSPAIVRRVVYTTRNTSLRRNLAQALGRKLLEERQHESLITRLKSLASPFAMERWGRAHGSDSVEVRSTLKSGIPFLLETSAEFGFSWDLKGSMENKSAEQMAELARQVFGKEESSQELVSLIDWQMQDPSRLNIDSRFMVLVGDFRRLADIAHTSSSPPTIGDGARAVEIEFEDDGWLKENAHLLDGRFCELLGEVSNLAPVKARCFSLWM